jgi:oligoribonuclease
MVLPTQLAIVCSRRVGIIARCSTRHFIQKIMSQDTKPSAAATPGSSHDERLVWLDMEMTGLDPDNDRIIEVALVVTDGNLVTLAEAPVYAIHQTDAVLAGMDNWNTATHARSGLTERVRTSTTTEAEVEEALIEFLKKHVGRGKSPMCGNSICQDRRFMARSMPKLEAFFHYRNLDVSTLKELCKRWKPEVAASFKKHQKHEALADIHESIEELKHYREHFLKV